MKVTTNFKLMINPTLINFVLLGFLLTAPVLVQGGPLRSYSQPNENQPAQSQNTASAAEKKKDPYSKFRKKVSTLNEKELQEAIKYYKYLMQTELEKKPSDLEIIEKLQTQLKIMDKINDQE